jgi:hypothetical protein
MVTVTVGVEHKPVKPVVGKGDAPNFKAEPKMFFVQ